MEKVVEKTTSKKFTLMVAIIAILVVFTALDSVSAQTPSSSIPNADIDESGKVDRDDYRDLKRHYEENGRHEDGEINEEDPINVLDLSILTAQFGKSGGSGCEQEYQGRPPFVIDHDHTINNSNRYYGNVIAHDLNGDGFMDYILTAGDEVSAFDHCGDRMWKDDVSIHRYDRQDRNALGLLYHPIAMAGDFDGDGTQEVGYMTSGGNMRILDGVTGPTGPRHDRPKHSYSLNAHVTAIANIRGQGDRDMVAQTKSPNGLKAYKIMSGDSIWPGSTGNSFRGIDHSAVRQADIDDDGRDEFAGKNILNDNGSVMQTGYGGDNVDSITISDIKSGFPLEVALAESGDTNDKVIVYNPNGNVFTSAVSVNTCCIQGCSNDCGNKKDCDKISVGNFDTSKPGEEVLCRSQCGQSPWMFDSNGNEIAQWCVPKSNGRPSWWHEDGIDQINRISWEGNGREHIAVTERHNAGHASAAIIDPKSGRFKEVFTANGYMLYVADVANDPREEVILVEDDKIKIFWNEDNYNGSDNRLWDQQDYRRRKQNYNYYSP